MSYQGFISSLSQEEHDFYEIKNAAAEFYRVNRVPEDIERALNELFLHKPEDVHGYLEQTTLEEARQESEESEEEEGDTA